jgi:hypothetical protein
MKEVRNNLDKMVAELTLDSQLTAQVEQGGK